MYEDKVAADEARRVAQHGSVKAQIEGDVNAEIKDRAQEATAAQSERVSQVADQLRGRALDETVASEHHVARSRGTARLSQYVDYVFYLIYALLGLRLVLALIGARSASGFAQFINGVTNPLYAPFRGIVPSPSAEGFTLLLPVAIAMLAYLLLHAGINGALRFGTHRKTAI